MEEDRPGDRDRLERTASDIGRLADRATGLEQWAAGRDARPAPGQETWIDWEAGRGHAAGSVYRYDEETGQWIAIGRIEESPRFRPAEQATGEGSEPFLAAGERFETADDVLDWWPTGDDTYRGADGYRVVPPAGSERQRTGPWITAEQWRQAARTPRQDEGTARRRYLERFYGSRPSRWAAGDEQRWPWTWNRHEWDRPHRYYTTGWPDGDDDGSEVGSSVAGPQERDGNRSGPYWIDEAQHWPGAPRITDLAGFKRWAEAYRRTWDVEQGQQPPVVAVRGSGSPLIEQRRTAARRDVRYEWRAFRRAWSLPRTEARHLVVAVREAVRWELIAAEWWLEPNAWQRVDRAGERAADLGRWIGHEASLWWVARPRPFWNGKG